MVGEHVLVLCACQAGQGQGQGQGQEECQGGGTDLWPGESPGQGMMLVPVVHGAYRGAETPLPD